MTPFSTCLERSVAFRRASFDLDHTASTSFRSETSTSLLLGRSSVSFPFAILSSSQIEVFRNLVLPHLTEIVWSGAWSLGFPSFCFKISMDSSTEICSSITC